MVLVWFVVNYVHTKLKKSKTEKAGKIKQKI